MSKMKLMAALVLAAGLSACSGDKDVREFAEKFGHELSDNDVAAIHEVYPESEKCDSFALDLIKDSIRIEKTDNPDIFIVSYGDGHSMEVKRKGENRFSVLSSKGLFAYPKAELRFAKATGALDKVKNDAGLAEVMDVIPAFRVYLYNEYKSKRKNALTNLGAKITKDIQYAVETGHGYYTIKNNTDDIIEGSEYELVWTDEYMGMAGYNSSTRVTPGKDVAPNNTITVPFTFTGHDFTSLSNIRIKDVTMDRFMTDFKAKGNEYETYRKAFPESKGRKDSPQGEIALAGKIGTKNAIHMSLDLDNHTGSYYYDKYGPGNRLTLAVKIYDPASGKIQIEERNPQGEVTGTFEGTLTSTELSGTMTNYKGKTFPFSFTVE